MFGKILIANRGEIAVRVQRTCRDMGLETVAVHSDADRKALHVRLADEAFHLPGNLPAETYLRADRILEIALDSGAEAVHPGYGFLAEDADFARACEAAGLAFIGPPAEALELMGDKLRSRAAMEAAGVAVVPGGREALADPAEAAALAEETGYPVMLKASAGGGGKGIRVVYAESGLEAAFRTASGEAQNAFGDGRLYLERFLGRPRHIEVQVLGDRCGRLVHLGERECSVQRRHQKLIEEAPSPLLDPARREQLTAAALRAAEAVGYHSAGTVEFLWSEGEFFFLEMNTRLQVEHGVTEALYGVDIVEQMIRVAAGEPLDLPDPLVPRGHAVEIRVNAEDPERDFAPSVGTVRNLRLPGGPGIRVDTAVFRGLEVTPYYDSLLAKIIVWGADREHCLRRAERALQEFQLGSVSHGTGFALEILRGSAFRSGDYDTGLAAGFQPDGRTSELEPVAAVVAALHRHHGAALRARSAGASRGLDPWVALGRRRALQRRPR